MKINGRPEAEHRESLRHVSLPLPPHPPNTNPQPSILRKHDGTTICKVQTLQFRKPWELNK